MNLCIPMHCMYCIYCHDTCTLELVLNLQCFISAHTMFLMPLTPNTIPNTTIPASVPLCLCASVPLSSAEFYPQYYVVREKAQRQTQREMQRNGMAGAGAGAGAGAEVTNFGTVGSVGSTGSVSGGAGGWQLYCDLDGVLADFDEGVKAIFGGRR